jgi:hypothetical protein
VAEDLLDRLECFFGKAIDEDLLDRLKWYFEDRFLQWSPKFAEYFLQQLIEEDARLYDEMFRNITLAALEGVDAS